MRKSYNWEIIHDNYTKQSYSQINFYTQGKNNSCTQSLNYATKYTFLYKLKVYFIFLHHTACFTDIEHLKIIQN